MTTKQVYLNTAAAAQRVGLRPGTLENWRYRQGKDEYDGPPYTRIGGKVFYESSAIDRWLDAHTVGQDLPQASGQ